MSNSGQTLDQTSDSRAVGRPLRRFLASASVLVVLFLLGSMVVFVDETEFVIVERFGRIVAVYDRPSDRGLRVKLPWPIDAVRRFDRRVQLFDPREREMFTRDKKNVTVDAYVCWKIAEPQAEGGPIGQRPVVRFLRGLGSIEVAEARLDARVRSVLSTEIGQVELSSLLRTRDSESGPNGVEDGLLQTVSESVRQKLLQPEGDQEDLRTRLGVDVVDVRIKRLNLPAGNQQAVFERMKSERRKIADRYRSAGLAENKMIRSQADRQYNEILARARADAERIRGESEAEAINILNRAHAQDPEFYRFVRTLDAYRQILNNRTTLVLSASSNLLKLLTDGLPEEAEESAEPQAPRTPSGDQPSEPVTATKPDAIEPEPVTTPDEASGGGLSASETDDKPSETALEPLAADPTGGGR